MANEKPLRKPRRAEPTREQRAYVALVSTADRVRGSYQGLYAPYDITHQQYNVLRILRGSQRGGLTCGEIGERTIARDPDVTRLVDRLAKRGLVKRARSQADRRVVQVEMTQKGLDLLRELDPHVQRMPRALLGHVSQARLQLLSKLLTEVLDGMGTFP